MRWVRILPAILIFISSIVQAQEEFIPPVAKHITSIPFRMLSGGIIIMKAKVSHYPDSLTFIFDTGSGGISLDSMTTVALGIEGKLSDKTIRGIAGIRQVKFAYNQKLHLPGLTVDSLNFHINDYDVLTSAYGEKIDGIIGYSFINRYILKIDYDSSKMHVFSKGTIKYPRGGFLLRPLLTSLPVMTAAIRDDREVASRFYFDTGAGMCLLLSNEFASDSAFTKPKRKWFSTQAEGLGGKAPMKQGVIKQVRIGPYRFRNVPTYIFDDQYNVTSYPYLAGLIGNDLLRRFNVILNYEKRDIHLLPNSHFKDVFDYSYTGIGMYVIDGEIRIVDVMPGSPAEKAGLKAEDIIMAVENNFSQSIQAYKNMLQSPGQRLKILVLREGEPIIISLKVKSIR